MVARKKSCALHQAGVKLSIQIAVHPTVGLVLFYREGQGRRYLYSRTLTTHLQRLHDVRRAQIPQPHLRHQQRLDVGVVAQALAEGLSPLHAHQVVGDIQPVQGLVVLQDLRHVQRAVLAELRALGQPQFGFRV